MSYTNGFRSTRAGILKRRFSCNGCVRERWRENKRKSQYDNEYSLTAARPLARVSTTEASKGVLNGDLPETQIGNQILTQYHARE